MIRVRARDDPEQLWLVSERGPVLTELIELTAFLLTLEFVRKIFPGFRAPTYLHFLSLQALMGNSF